MAIASVREPIGLDPAAVAAHYDDLDRYYRELWGEHVHHGLFDAARDDARRGDPAARRPWSPGRPGRPGSAVCDVGCGYGATARVLARDYGARVTALTISAAQHAYAQTVEPGADEPAATCSRLAAERPRPASSFDAVIAIESTEHMADLAAFFERSARVLRPGGRLVVCAWLTRDRLRGWERRSLIGPICREGRLRGMETADEYRRLGRASGLEPARGPRPQPTGQADLADLRRPRCWPPSSATRPAAASCSATAGRTASSP